MNIEPERNSQIYWTRVYETGSPLLHRIKGGSFNRLSWKNWFLFREKSMNKNGSLSYSTHKTQFQINYEYKWHKQSFKTFQGTMRYKYFYLWDREVLFLIRYQSTNYKILICPIKNFCSLNDT